MSDIAIRVKNVSKRFRLGEGQSFDNVREAVAHVATAPLRWFRGNAASNGNGHVPAPDVSDSDDPDELWALRDISFEVKRGEVLGIIGRNGAGKSTLLKVLSRITEPTSGHIDLFGRVASLLEVGTGFHQDLTGRENVYLNGAILGMSRAEIKSKFDEIVAFAGVERFIDTPVKRYSSGMGVRLGFAVAAHLEPEILIVDEVLAVGDAEFQRKCLGKMDDVARSGRTVLFVSHNMAAVQALCTRVMLLDSGRCIADGSPHSVLETYSELGAAHCCGVADLRSHPGRTAASDVVMHEVRIGNGESNVASSVPMGGSIKVSALYVSTQGSINPVLGVVVKDSHGAAVFGVNNRFIGGYSFSELSQGTICCRILNLPLMPGRYTLDLHFGDTHRNLDVVHDAIAFDVIAADVFGTGKLPPPAAGPIFWPAEWSVESAVANARCDNEVLS